MPDLNDRLLLEKLWALWQRFPPVAEPAGERIFTRWVDLQPDDPGWNDWMLTALVRPDGTLHWIDSTQTIPGVAESLWSGRTHGIYVEGELRIEWVRSAGDGPPGPRVSDWAEVDP